MGSTALRGHITEFFSVAENPLSHIKVFISDVYKRAIVSRRVGRDDLYFSLLVAIGGEFFLEAQK
jgi:hypothetical protein